ncbi:hypothetical protein [Rhodovulum sp. MB263]|uniref:hypothetical protein n=1 Tax=Rhodovulum sp. (strain MB263) TaxID=308754 RepID=UPI0009B77F72|nr:hypothetical protein [Rhodovulum sp. MB263]ARC89768.1 hypothetical protein B5V46_14725 [Rhodovulum sp. MB263]
MRPIRENFPIRERWIRTAGPWADEPIRRFTRADAEQFLITREILENVPIDPRRISYMSNVRYTQGMTWRAFLTEGGNIDNALYVLTYEAQYYDDPLADQLAGTSIYSTPGWTLIEIDGHYSVDEGHHRSAIAKFRAHEDGMTGQRIPRLERFKVDHAARHTADRLSQILLPGQDFKVLREPIGPQMPEKQEWRILFQLHRVRGHDGNTYLPDEALAYAEAANQAWRPYDVITKLLGLFRR